MQNDKLLPCPFCSCNDRRVSVRRMGNKGYKVICGACGGAGPYVAIKVWHDNKMIAQGQAKKLWNTRNPMKQIRKQLLERMEDLAGYTDDDIFLGEYNGYKGALEIVRKGGKE